MSTSSITYLKKLLLASLFYFICLGLGVLVNAIFDRQGNMFYAPAFSAIFGGVVYYLYLLPQRKFGLITLVAGLLSLFFLTSGHYWASIVPYWCFGLAADVLASTGRYQDNRKNALSFFLYALTTTGPILFMWLAPKAYIATLEARGKSADYINRVMLEPQLTTILWFLATILVGALVGIVLGQWLSKQRNQKNGANTATSCFNTPELKD